MSSSQTIEITKPSLIAVTEHTPPITSAVDADVDLEILRTIPKQFEIKDEKTANWLVRKIVAAREYAANVKLWSELELKRAAREEQTLFFLFGRQIERWVKQEIDGMGGRRKSLALPSGSVGFRSVGPKIVIDDEALVISWAKANLPTAVVVYEKLAKSVVNEHAEKSGELPDGGVHVEPASERFYIK